nr:MAG TPA: hypothetical protein [Caudoviricetes sp.]
MTVGRVSGINNSFFAQNKTAPFYNKGCLCYNIIVISPCVGITFSRCSVAAE